MIPQVFTYNGQDVSFDKEKKSTFINATQMAKVFGKFTKDWLKTTSTKSFISALLDSKNSEVIIIPSAENQQVMFSDLVFVKKGGNKEQGTWMHEDVAIEFARWLNPLFAIWCNERTKELMTVGFTATEPTMVELLDNPDLIIELATKLKKYRAEKAALNQKLSKANNIITDQKPTVDC